MAKLTMPARKALPSSDFAVPSKAPGSGSYPIPDPGHGANALARAAGKPVAPQVDAAVHRKFPGLGKSTAAKAPPAKAGGRVSGGSSGHSGDSYGMDAMADRLHPLKAPRR